VRRNPVAAFVMPGSLPNQSVRELTTETGFAAIVRREIPDIDTGSCDMLWFSRRIAFGATITAIFLILPMRRR
jgi:hypothetical protein